MSDDMSQEEALKQQEQNCIFCKIIKGEIPSKKIYEDDNFFAFLDINPASEGHTIVVPKKHAPILPLLDPEIAGSLGIACKNVSKKLLEGLGVQGTSIFIANGAVAGQNAPHVFAHVIPRKENDDINLNPESKDINNYEDVKKKILGAIQK